MIDFKSIWASKNHALCCMALQLGNGKTLTTMTIDRTDLLSANAENGELKNKTPFLRCWQSDEKHDQTKPMLEEVLRLQERDRKLIAYEIHDGLVQEATAAQMLLSTLLQNGSLPQGDLREKIQEASDLIQNSINEARRLIGGLRPAILEKSGVIEAINFLITNLHSNTLKIDFFSDVKFLRLESMLETTIFRIVQQAVHNIQQHSKAEKAEIRLTQQGNNIHLEIQDWGIGFNPANINENRLGLQGIRERARLMHGRAIIDSAAGKGTQIIVDLPVVFTHDNK